MIKQKLTLWNQTKQTGAQGMAKETDIDLEIHLFVYLEITKYFLFKICPLI